MSNKKERIRVLIPVLFKFEDDKVSIDDDFLKLVKDKLVVKKYNLLKDKNDKTKLDKKMELNGFQFINRSPVMNKEALQSVKGQYKSITLYVYYYHHRIIFDFNIIHEGKLASKLSGKIRDHLTSYIDKEMLDILKIYEKLRNSKEGKNILKKYHDGAKIISYHSYPIIIQRVKKNFVKRMNNRLETMFFKIFLPNRRWFSFGSPAYIRISIPSIYLFHKNRISNELLSDFINTVYETGLYEKKLKEADEYKKRIEKYKDEKDYDKYINKFDDLNRFDETILSGMWQHFLNTLDGKIASHQQQKISRVSYFAGLFGLVVAIIALIISIK